MKSNIASLFEELRKAIDEGSESMTHDDALKQIAYWQDKEQAQAVEKPVAKDWTHEAREKAGYEEGWNDCMTLFASHMKRMNNALVDKPPQASYKIKKLK